MIRRRTILHLPALALAVLAFGLALAGCDPVEGHEGGLFAPFGGGVVQQAGGDEQGGATGGGIQLPDAEDFAPADPTPVHLPVLVDTGGPPVVVGDDDDSARSGEPGDGLTHLGDPVVAATPAPLFTEPLTPQPVPLQTPPVITALVPTHPLQTAPAGALTAAQSETALSVSAPLSEILLVAAIPDSTPPRAIVRFPNGEERVVQIGDLLGDSGAKVVLIGAGFIKLAELTVDEPDRPAMVTHYVHRMR